MLVSNMNGVVARRFIALATARRPIAAALMQAAVRGSLMTTQHRACKLAAIKIQAVARHFTYQQQQADIKRMQMAVLMQAAARSRVASSAIDVKKSAAFLHKQQLNVGFLWLLSGLTRKQKQIKGLFKLKWDLQQFCLLQEELHVDSC